MKIANRMTKITTAALFAVALFAIVISSVHAGKGSNAAAKSKPAQLWKKVDKSSLKSSRGQFAAISDKIPVYNLNQNLLKNLFDKAPLELTEAARVNQTVLEIPNPDGGTMRFRIVESPMLSAENQALFPTWKQFAGQGIDDPTATARFDVNDNGFHGYVIGANGTFLIDPYSLTDKENYIVYHKGDIGDGNRENFSCQFKETPKTTTNDVFAPTSPAAFSNGTELRNFRIAVAATKEYTNFFGGNVTTAFAAIQTTVNRMILIYRRDLATTFTLVSNNSIVFTNANDGGYPDASSANVATDSLTRNQIVIDNAVGNTNYDIGHVFSRTPNPNGVAQSPSLCNNASKAQGFTGAQTPQGDGYDVDYVAHEIGHQFNMSHTFNNDNDGSCNTREPDSAYEPASGITIMAYGGICAPRNLAQNSIDYFNLRSFEQSLKWFSDIRSGTFGGIDPACGTPTGNNNNVPTITAPGDFTIPKLTPFTLTATASDANGDALTYLWEEFDLGGATRNNGAVDTDADGIARPIFRAYNASTNRSRTFPTLNYILSNANVVPATYTGRLPNAPASGSSNGYVCAATETCTTGESLPSIARTMVFRVTVRDNNPNGGGIVDAQSTIIVDGGSGPFQITTQNSAVSTNAINVNWAIGTTQTVTWNPANTNVAPVSAANVNILLSTDGGQTFPIVLKANTLNDGTEPIVVPNNATTTARIKVEAVGNIFFDINDTNFAISTSTAAGISVSGSVTSAKGRAIRGAMIRMTDENGQTVSARTNAFGNYRFANVPVGRVYVFTVAAKGHNFDSQVMTLNEDSGKLNFRAQQN